MKNKPIIYIKFVDFWPNFDIHSNFFLEVLSENHTVIINDNPDFIIYSSFGDEFLKYDCVRVFYTGENIEPNFKECDYALSFFYDCHQSLSYFNNYFGKQRSFRLPLYVLYHRNYKHTPQNKISKNIDTERDFCNFLYSSVTCKIRNHFFHKLCSYKKVNSGGKAFNNIGHIVEQEDTLNYLSRHKFSIAFENNERMGYTTEKLYNSFIAKTVPIYWGNPLVTKDFNAKAFISAYDFNNFDELVAYVIKVDNDDKLYLEYLNQPMFANGVNNHFINWNNIVSMFDTIFSDKNTHFAIKGNIIYRKTLRFLIKKFTKTLNSLKKK